MQKFYKKALALALGLIIVSIVLACIAFEQSHLRLAILGSDDSDVLWRIEKDTDSGRNGKSTVQILSTRPRLRLAMTVSSAAPHPYSAVNLFFNDASGRPTLQNLSAYQTVSFYVQCSQPNTLTLTVPTFDEAVSRRDDILSYRTLAAFFPCDEKISRVELDLTRLETPQWWLDLFRMDLLRHGYQLDKVPKIAIGSTYQSPRDIPVQLEISKLHLNGRDFRYPIAAAVFLLILWVIFAVWFFRAHARALVTDLNHRLQKDLPLLAYQQLSLEPHRDKEKAAILRHIATHYTRPDLDIETVAREVATTRSKINEVLKAELGYTFSGYLNKLRLTESARLLAEKSTATVAEIAYSVGYSNISYFNKLFKEEYGATPKAFRTVAREAD